MLIPVHTVSDMHSQQLAFTNNREWSFVDLQIGEDKRQQKRDHIQGQTLQWVGFNAFVFTIFSQGGELTLHGKYDLILHAYDISGGKIVNKFGSSDDLLAQTVNES